MEALIIKVSILLTNYHCIIVFNFCNDKSLSYFMTLNKSTDIYFHTCVLIFLNPYSATQNFSWRHFVFLSLTFHVSCLPSRQFTWNAILFFLKNNTIIIKKKITSECRLLQFCLVLSRFINYPVSILHKSIAGHYRLRWRVDNGPL